MEVPRLVQLELQLLAYNATTARPDPSHECNLHHSSQQRQIPTPLREARDQTRNLVVPSRIHFCCATTGTPLKGSSGCYLLSGVIRCAAIPPLAPNKL